MDIKVYDKPYKSIDEQIAYLRTAHGLIIKNNDFARQALITISYYDLINRYQSELMVRDFFVSGITIEYLYELYLLDKDFQNVLFENSVLIENIYKTKLANVLAKNFGVDMAEYLDNRKYVSRIGKISFYETRDAFYRVCYELDKSDKKLVCLPRDSIDQSTRHYVMNHNHIPPWIILRNVSFSNAINLFRVMKPPQKKELVDLLLGNNKAKFEDKLGLLISSLGLIRKFRNIIAHNLRFVGYVSDKHCLPKKAIVSIGMYGQIIKGRDKLNDVFAYMIAMYVLLGSTDLRVRYVDDLNRIMENGNRFAGKERGKTLWDDYANMCKFPVGMLGKFGKLVKKESL